VGQRVEKADLHTSIACCAGFQGSRAAGQRQHRVKPGSLCESLDGMVAVCGFRQHPWMRPGCRTTWRCPCRRVCVQNHELCLSKTLGFVCGFRQHPWFAPGLPDYLAVPMPALGLHGLPPLPDPRVLGQLTTLGLDAQVRVLHSCASCCCGVA
jgi:hypothetical protein